MLHKKSLLPTDKRRATGSFHAASLTTLLSLDKHRLLLSLGQEWGATKRLMGWAVHAPCSLSLCDENQQMILSLDRFPMYEKKNRKKKRKTNLRKQLEKAPRISASQGRFFKVSTTAEVGKEGEERVSSHHLKAV